MSTYIRTSQRAPTACLRCARKRIKCDKQVPCQNCVGRGLESSCAREVVRVKGQITSPKPPETGPTYAELQEENRRLKAQLATSLPRRRPENTGTQKLGSVIEVLEAQINFPVHNLNSSTVRRVSDIYLPSEECSRALVEHGFVWTSWIHFAVHIPTFRAEHERCWKGRDRTPLLDNEPLWLAIYFSFLAMSLLFMDEKEVEAARLPLGSTVSLIRNWYDAGLFFLNEADYLRRLDMRSVQTIAILLGLFKTLGDSSLDFTLLSIGIRIGQCLGMDKEPPLVTQDPVEQEVSRRVWWTLIICEWLQRPLRPPMIHEADFVVNMPLDLDDEQIMDPDLRANPQTVPMRPRPVHYHITMIKLAQLTHRFNEEVMCAGSDSISLEKVVLRTDEALANIIEELPPHLSEDPEDLAESTPEPEQYPPWVLWQRNSLYLSILFYRMAINRILQHQWVQSENSYARTQAICLGSARAIVSLADRYSAALARHRPWATTSGLFSAAITLAVEARFSDEHTAAAYTDDIDRCLTFFASIADQNVVASRSIDVLRQYMSVAAVGEAADATSEGDEGDGGGRGEGGGGTVAEEEDAVGVGDGGVGAEEWWALN